MMRKIGLSVLLGMVAFGAEAPKEFTGIVTDTMCGAKPHSAMLRDKTDAECTRICARGAYGFALLDGANVMKLSDQKASGKYAGQKVRVMGTYDEKSRILKVVSIAPDGTN